MRSYSCAASRDRPDRTHQHVVSDEERGEAVGLVLPGLPGDRRLLKVGQVPGDAGGADFESLPQARRTGLSVATAATAALRWPGRHPDRVRRPGRRPVTGRSSDPTPPAHQEVGVRNPALQRTGLQPQLHLGNPVGHSHVVIRLTASVEVDRSAKFTSDQTCVRCVLRVGFAWAHPASVVRIGLGGS